MNTRHALILLVLAETVLLLPSAKAQDKSSITLEDIWRKDTFSSETLAQIRSMKDGLHYTVLEPDGRGQAICKYSYQTGKKVGTVARSAEMVPEGKREPISIAEYRFSPDESKLLVATDVETIYRHSTRETNYLFDLTTKELAPLSHGARQQHATFSPVGDKVAFVRANNIFFKNLGSGSEVQVTQDGEINRIINGATDWVYEEEFGFDRAFFWSPNGKRIAYYRFDESRVREFQMDKYGGLYPEPYRYKYPKAGEENSRVRIQVYDVERGQSLVHELEREYEYIPRIQWTQDPLWLCVFKMNRHQNKLDLVLLHAASGETRIMFRERSDTWIDITDNLTFLADKQRFLWTSEEDGYNHIYLHDVASGKRIRQITTGKWDVTGFKGVDEERGLLYYLSAEESPLERRLYSIKLDGSERKRLTTQRGTNEVEFSASYRFFINTHTDANSPEFITLHETGGPELRVLVDNRDLRKRLERYAISRKEFFSFETSEKVKLNGWMIKPLGFREGNRYPVLMSVYGGPGSQTVRDDWDYNYAWYQMLAEMGYIIVSVDNRGTGARGRDFKNCTYRQLGKIETVDQIEAARYLQTLPYVAPDRIGIWGWSYGGYMASLCLTQGADVFRMAMAVAPVTHWRYYDTIYTERYLQTPQENPGGYDDNSPIRHVGKMKGKYLLVHGMADDNVHLQNAVEMVGALIEADKHFDLYLYPDRNHGIHGGNARYHLYRKMTDFIRENL